MLAAINSPEATSPIRGNVYGIAWHSGSPVSTKPDGARPTSPVLFFKPKNTYLPGGGTVWIPETMGEVDICASVALIFGRDARCVTAEEAFSYVAGYTLALDISEPDIPVLRPPIREKCRDGFLPIGKSMAEWTGAPSLAELQLTVKVNGVTVKTFDLRDQADSIAAGIEQISSYMTLRAGDALLAECLGECVRVTAGSTIAISCAELGRLECQIKVEAGLAR